MSKEVLEVALKLSSSLHEDFEDWANQPRAVWDGKTLEKELDELFPVEVGLQALREKLERESKQ
jgi:hypothetical protein